ncbi:MAG: four helix bundle protein, partial [Planctomyces sp.]
MAQHYRELIAWQKAMDLVVHVYDITKQFPDDERFGLVSQMRRCAVSVPSNIAEGQA